MPKIPFQENSAGQINQQAPYVRPASPQEFGEGAGQALQQLGDTIGNTVDSLSKKFGDIYNESQANSEIANATRDLNDTAFQLKNGSKTPFESTGGQPDGSGGPTPTPPPGQATARAPLSVDPSNPRAAEIARVNARVKAASGGAVAPEMQQLEPAAGDPPPVMPQDNGEEARQPSGDPSQDYSNPTNHQSIFQNKIDEIRARAEQNLTGAAYRHFLQTFEPMANHMMVGVQNEAIGLVHGQSRADLQDMLVKQTDNFADANPYARADIKNHAFAAIDNAATNRQITPEEAFQMKKTFTFESEYGLARKIAYSGPDGPQHLMDAVRMGEFNDLPAQQREKLFDMATNRAYTMARQANTNLEHRERMVRMQEKVLGEGAAKQGYDLLLEGKLTPEWFEGQNAQYLPFSEYKMLKKGMMEGEDTPSNQQVVKTFEREIFQGHVITDKLDLAGGVTPAGKDAEGQESFIHDLNSRDYLRLKTLQAQYGNTVKGDPVARGEMDRIHKLFGGNSFLKSVGQEAAGADAQNEFLQWRMQHGDATAEEMRAKSDEVTKRHSLAESIAFIRSSTRPKFLPTEAEIGTPGYEDQLKSAGAAAQAAAQAGKISGAEFSEEKKRIVQYLHMNAHLLETGAKK